MTRYIFTIKLGFDVVLDSFIEMRSNGTKKDPLGLTDINSDAGKHDLEALEVLKRRATITGGLGPYIVGSVFPISPDEFLAFLRERYRQNDLERFLETCGLSKALMGVEA